MRLHVKSFTFEEQKYMTKELIFVYNADSGKWNAYMDMMHKVFSPKTYPCSLCAITYGIFSIKKEWQEFINNFPVNMKFLHRNEWLTEFSGNKETLPAIFLKEGNQITTYINSSQLHSLSLKDLINELNSDVN